MSLGEVLTLKKDMLIHLTKERRKTSAVPSDVFLVPYLISARKITQKETRTQRSRVV